MAKNTQNMAEKTPVWQYTQDYEKALMFVARKEE